LIITVVDNWFDPEQVLEEEGAEKRYGIPIYGGNFV
jgi:hypothetical protein